MHYVDRGMLRTIHNLVDVTTFMLPWYNQICDLIKSLKSQLKSREFSQNFDYELHILCEMSPDVPLT